MSVSKNCEALSQLTEQSINVSKALLQTVTVSVIEGVKSGDSRALERVAGSIALAAPDMSAVQLLRSLRGAISEAEDN